MQHRIDLRLALRLPVMISSYIDPSNRRIIWGRTRDMSFTGMYVEIADTNLPDDRYIDACIVSKVCGEIRISGLVIRHDADGIGILFDDYNTDISQHLGTLMSLYFDNAGRQSAFLHENQGDLLAKKAGH
jgi:hypothetical protein